MKIRVSFLRQVKIKKSVLKCKKKKRKKRTRLLVAIRSDPSATSQKFIREIRLSTSIEIEIVSFVDRENTDCATLRCSLPEVRSFSQEPQEKKTLRMFVRCSVHPSMNRTKATRERYRERGREKNPRLESCDSKGTKVKRLSFERIHCH